MGKTPRSPRALQAVVLDIGLIQVLDRVTVVWEVEVQKPGGKGMMKREWVNHSGQLTSDQVADLASWVAKTVENAIVVWGGVQGVIET